MKKFLLIILSLVLTLGFADAQVSQSRNSIGGSSSGNNSRSGLRGGAKSDSLSSHSNKDKEIPKGRKVWTVDERFGDIRPAAIDTVTHMFMNTIFTDGLRGEYNFTGNLGAPRINRIFSERKMYEDQFMFMQPYDYFAQDPSEFLFTNTYSPLANLTYNFCGNRTNGEDHFQAKYGVNVNKQLGFGFDINYLYGRGYYSDQSTSLFHGGLYGYYHGERYQAHLLLTSNKQKIFENGGITNDLFITNPESFDDNYATSEIPTILSDNWNRNSNQHIFLTHRYNIGFNRKVPMSEKEIEMKKFAMQSEKDNAARKAAEERRKNGEEVDEDKLKKEMEAASTGRPDNAKVAGNEPAAEEAKKNNREVMDLATSDSLNALKKKAAEEEQWMKDEYVPVTSFIHTLRLDNYERIYQAHRSPNNFYAEDFYAGGDVIGGDSIFDKTKHFRLRNTLAMSMLEGFNKWMMAGIKLYAKSDLRHYTLPNEFGKAVAYNDHNLSVGGQLSKTQGNTLHYNVTGETCLLGDEQTQVKIDGSADLNFKLFGDTLTLAASGFFHTQKPSYYLRHYHSRHFWWDENLSMMTHTRLQGLFRYQKTRTTLRASVDELTDYTYIGETYTPVTSGGMTDYNLRVRQSSDAISLLTLDLGQDLTFGPLNWESKITLQKSTKQDVLPVPLVNIYTNLFLKFRIAKVLQTELGADMRYFTKYTAPDYAPSLGQFVVQENAEKIQTGNYPFINAYANFNLKGTRFFIMYSRAYSSAGNSFTVPHYPVNPGTLRIGLSWDFYN